MENIDAPWQELDLCKSDECRVCVAECVSVFRLGRRDKDRSTEARKRLRRSAVCHDFDCSRFKLIAPWTEFDFCKSDECRVCVAECLSVFGLVDRTRTGPLKQDKDSGAQNERPRSETSVLVRTTRVSEKVGHNHSLLNRDAKSVFWFVLLTGV